MEITERYGISKDLIRYVMRKKINLLTFLVDSLLAEKNLDLFIKFILNNKILNQSATYLYYKCTVNHQIDEIDKIRSISFSFIIFLFCYIESICRIQRTHLLLIRVHSPTYKSFNS